MIEWWCRRAECDEESQMYSVLHEDGSRVTYSCVCLDDTEDEITLALQKAWEDDGQHFTLYPFRKL